ncbi:transcriptional regulator [Natronoarchaeum mannanilyticum]
MADLASNPNADVDAAEAAAAFGSLADENRIAILLALWSEEELSFADLQSAAEFEDSSLFNYHLGKLVGRFVEKEDDRYRLRAAGAKAIDVVVDERFGSSSEPVDLELDAACPDCGTPLRARYENDTITIDCPGCDCVVHLGYFPPRGRAARDPEAFLEAYAKRLWRDFTLAYEGICPRCSGRTSTRVEVDPDWHLDLPAVSDCADCGVSIGTTIGLRLLADPAVVAFLWDHGDAVDGRPFWEFPFCLDDADAEVVSQEPFRVVVPIERGGEVLQVTVDEAAQVVETARVTNRQS